MIDSYVFYPSIEFNLLGVNDDMLKRVADDPKWDIISAKSSALEGNRKVADQIEVREYCQPKVILN